jgi:hypothetical protein
MPVKDKLKVTVIGCALVAALCGAARADITDELLAYWDLNDGSGFTAAEASNSAYDGSLVNMEEGDWTAGKFCGGLLFDGDNERVDCDVSTPELVSDATVSVACWFRTQAETGTLVSWNNTSHSNKHTGIALEDGKLKWSDFDRTRGPGTTAVNDGEWHHVVFVGNMAHDATRLLFLDGALELDATGTGGGGRVPDLTLTFGAQRRNAASDYFAGELDEIRVYDRLFDLAAAQELYQADIPCGGAVIPEPLTVLSVLAGGGALAGYLRRRRA